MRTPTDRPQTRAFPSTLALVLALIGAFSFLYYHEALFMPRVVAVRAAAGLGHGYSFGNDFYQVWLTSREMLRQKRNLNFYSEDMTREIQVGLYGRPLDPSRTTDPTDRRVFPYPAYTDLIFWPAAEFRFEDVRIVVLCALTALTLATAWLWIRVFDWPVGWKWIAVVLLLTLTSYSALEGLFAGQLGLLVSFLLAAAIFALLRNRLLLAGFLMALTTIKPQVTALAIIYLLFWSLSDWRNRRRFLAGFFAALGVLLAASLAAFPTWIQSWIHTVLAYRHYTRPPLVTEVLTSPLGPHLSPPATFVLTLASIAIAITLAWKYRAAAAGSFLFLLTLSSLLAITTITILPGQAVYDHLILIPGILLLARCWQELWQSARTTQILLSFCAFIFFWPWIAAFALLLLRPLLNPAVFYSTAVFALPIRSAASTPFAALALLGWMWRSNPSRIDTAPVIASTTSTLS